MADISRTATRRAPLGEATRRVNNAQPKSPILSSPKEKHIPHHDSLRVGGLLQVRSPPPSPLSPKIDDTSHDHTGSPANPRLSAISKEYPNSNRNSQISTVSTNASDGKKIKSLIGPWRLGRTLGRGATARVRRARHNHTGQEAAVKIVQKQNAKISQAGSLAALDKAMSTMPDAGDGIRRMPVGIEREVAIMKLIEHPNIMKLYDIWENRQEIYLVLEYVDNGELFEHIASKVRLEEEEAIKFFRQMLSAVGYCHSINICHRDLKPENILLTSGGDIKIADFGMAALHQSPGSKLRTSCGSPHYAAPELVRGEKYRGEKVDIWSLGVILFAMLAGRLPFDVDTPPDRDWIPSLLNKIRRGAYEMDSDFGPDTKSLIWKILQVNPRDRINMEQIWKHPLIRKYDHLDNFGGGYPLSPRMKSCVIPVLRRSDIDKELMRHLRSMWHTLTEEQLILCLLSDAPNDQKMFYYLFLKYRDNQLENYVPDGVVYSASDYHHVRPQGMTKTYSTCHFPQTKGHGRQASRFTVISNGADTECSYDPFKASRPQHINRLNSDRIKITIHRQSQPSLPRPVSKASSSRSRLQTRSHASRSSLASSTRSRNSGFRASTSYKRGVSFSYTRRRSYDSASTLQNIYRHSNNTEVTDDGGDFLRPVAVPIAASTRYIRSRKAQAATSQPLLAPPKPARLSVLWNEDVRQLSTTLADDCDKAFNRTSIMTDAETVRTSILSEKRASTGEWKAKMNQHDGELRIRTDPYSSRPLPPPPAQTKPLKSEMITERRKAEARPLVNGSPGYLDRMASQLDKFIQPSSIELSERRALSAPVEKRKSSLARPLPSIFEAKEATPQARRSEQRKDLKSSRIASAPEPRASVSGAGHVQPIKNTKGTIRVVNPSSPAASISIPEPLAVRKVSLAFGPSSVQAPLMSGGLGEGHPFLDRRPIRQQYLADGPDTYPELECIDEGQIDEYAESHTGTVVKNSSWLRKSKGSDDGSRFSAEGSSMQQSTANDSRPRELPLPPLPKKKSLGSRIGQLFKKTKTGQMAVGAHDVFDDNASAHESVANNQESLGRSENTYTRQIEPQQSWLARMFHIKPASKFICFSVSKRRARQEITNILKEWRRYGIRDVQVDKDRNIVFGKVSAKNYLNMKEVAFAGEIMTVIEHGKRSQLSIARFTQEQGAASSFTKVVETLETVLKCRGLLVPEERKKRMMIKTLNSAS